MADSSTATTEHTDIAALSFEEALRELEAIVTRMEGGEVALEQSLNDYARGAALKAHCEQKLADAKLRVEQVMAEHGTATGVTASSVSSAPADTDG